MLPAHHIGKYDNVCSGLFLVVFYFRLRQNRNVGLNFVVVSQGLILKSFPYHTWRWTSLLFSWWTFLENLDFSCCQNVKSLLVCYCFFVWIVRWAIPFLLKVASWLSSETLQTPEKNKDFRYAEKIPGVVCVFVGCVCSCLHVTVEILSLFESKVHGTQLSLSS